MIHPCFLAFIEDMAIRTKLEDIARLKDIECYMAGRGEQLSQLAKTINPFLFIADLSGPDSEWLFRHIAFIKFTRSRLWVVAIVHSSQSEVKSRAESYGCDTVISKADLMKKGADLIERALRKA